MPENNTPEGAQGQEIVEKLKPLGVASVDELIGNHQKLVEERDKLKKQHEDAQKFIAERNAEIGELRKSAKPAAAPKEGENTNAGATGTVTTKPQEPSLDEIEAAMSDEQKAKADQVYQGLPDVTPDTQTGLSKALVASNPEIRRKFLSIAKEAVPSVPKSLWDKPKHTAATAPTVSDDRIRALFNINRKAGSFVPPGPSGAASTTHVPAEDEKPRGRRVGTGGVLERINRDRKELSATV